MFSKILCVEPETEIILLGSPYVENDRDSYEGDFIWMVHSFGKPRDDWVHQESIAKLL